MWPLKADDAGKNKNLELQDDGINNNRSTKWSFLTNCLSIYPTQWSLRLLHCESNDLSLYFDNKFMRQCHLPRQHSYDLPA